MQVLILVARRDFFLLSEPWLQPKAQGHAESFRTIILASGKPALVKGKMISDRQMILLMNNNRQ